jgi:hypothetical protein
MHPQLIEWKSNPWTKTEEEEEEEEGVECEGSEQPSLERQ